MSEILPQSPALQRRWKRDGALHHVWRALSLSNTADCLDQMSRETILTDPEKQAKRRTILAMCKGFVEADCERELKLARDELMQLFAGELP